MKSFRRAFLNLTGLSIIFALCYCIFLNTQPVYAQNKLTYQEIKTALNNKFPNRAFKTKAELIKWLIVQIKQRKIDTPLTKDVEEVLRQADATNELINAIKANSPSLTDQTSIPVPTPTPILISTPTPKPVYSSFLENGDKYFNEFDFDRAIEEYTKVLEIDPQNVNALVQRGYARHYKGLNSDSVNDYNSAIKIKPILESESNMVCVLYNATRDNVDNAVENCNKAISAKPNFSLFFYKRANAYRHKRNYSQAIGDYTEAINIYPNFYSAYLNRGLTYVSNLNEDKAFADFDKAISLNPKNVSAYYARGVLYSTGDLEKVRKNSDKAIVEFNKVIEIDPKNAAAYYSRGRAYMSRSRIYITNITPNSPNMKDIDQAINDFDRAVNLDIAPNFIKFIADQYLIIGDKYQSIAELSKAIKLDPKSFAAYMERGIMLANKGDCDKAIADFSIVIEMKARQSLAFYYRGQCYFRKRDYDLALDDYNKAIEFFPQNASFYDKRADVYEKMGKKDLAQKDRITASELKR